MVFLELLGDGRRSWTPWWRSGSGLWPSGRVGAFGDLLGTDSVFMAPGLAGPVDSTLLAQRLTKPSPLDRPEEEQSLDVERVSSMASA